MLSRVPSLHSNGTADGQDGDLEMDMGEHGGKSCCHPSQHMCRARQHDKGTSGYSDMLLGQVYVNVTNAFSINFLAEGFKMCVAFIKHR